jgi:hypothetical protein
MLDPKNFYSKIAACARAKVSLVTLDSWRDRGLLRTYREGTRILISKDELEDLLAHSCRRRKPGPKTGSTWEMQGRKKTWP